MKIHEYQAKRLLAQQGVAVPNGRVATSVDEAEAVAKSLGGDKWVVKAQIHAGGRGKGGGVKVVNGLDELKEAASSILGMQLITPQTGPEGQKVRRILIEEVLDIKTELYISILVDRERRSLLILASSEGGMEIEEVAETMPEKIIRQHVSWELGLQNYQSLVLAYAMGAQRFGMNYIRPLSEIIKGLCNSFLAYDCSLVEVNPLILSGDGRAVALDAKITLEDNALFRHPKLHDLRDTSEENELELEASKYSLNYIKLDGNIGCMVNGAGLAMGTMDIIKAAGGEPANFLDVGGDATQERVEKAFEVITSDPNVKSILINIFGGIVHCDVVAKGVVSAYKNIGLDVPVVVRLQGTNAVEAGKIIEGGGLGDKLLRADGLREAAELSVKMASN